MKGVHKMKVITEEFLNYARQQFYKQWPEWEVLEISAAPFGAIIQARHKSGKYWTFTIDM